MGSRTGPLLQFHEMGIVLLICLVQVIVKIIGDTGSESVFQTDVYYSHCYMKHVSQYSLTKT